jgi:hypothetical protein
MKHNQSERLTSSRFLKKSRALLLRLLIASFSLAK